MTAVLLPFERDAAERATSGFLALADDAGLEALARPVRGLDLGAL